MALPHSREELKQYALRKLGHPILEINVTDEQLEDRLDDALDMFQERHFDATERVYITYRVTAADVTNRYITLPDDIVTVGNILPYGEMTSMFRLTLGDIAGEDYASTLASFDAITYALSRLHQATISELIGNMQSYEFSRKQNRLYLHGGLDLGARVVLEVNRAIDPQTIPALYSDLWLRSYVTALFKKQWAENLSKYSGIQLPGGVTLNSADMLSQAKEEITELEKAVMTQFQLPVDFYVG